MTSRSSYVTTLEFAIAIASVGLSLGKIDEVKMLLKNINAEIAKRHSQKAEN